MRFAPFVRPLPRQPKLPNPKLTSQDVARALTEVLQNQAVLMNEIAQIKNAMLWLNGQIFCAMLEIPTPDDDRQLIFDLAFRVNAQLTQALSD